MKGLRKSNKGFTLVEICVVLVLFSILASVTTLSLISWQEYSKYKSQEDNAELIYMAARNKIAQLKANNALDELSSWGEKISGNTVDPSSVIYSHTGTIYYAICKKGDYQNYNSSSDSTNSPDKKASLIFELINNYISDKGILNANIAIEYSQDGTIYAVYFSDSTEMDYQSSGLGTNEKFYMNGSYKHDSEKLYENVIGAYVLQ